MGYGQIIAQVAAQIGGDMMDRQADKKSREYHEGIRRSGAENIEGSSSTVRGTEESQSATSDLFSYLTQDLRANSAYSREAAIADSSAAAGAAMQAVLESGIPSNTFKQNATGAYNSSTVQRMNADTADRAGAAYATVVQDTIARYAQIENQQQATTLQALLGAIQTAQASKEDTKTTQDKDFWNTEWKEGRAPKQGGSDKGGSDMGGMFSSAVGDMFG